MSASGSVPTRGRRHPIWAVTRARELSAAGWKDVDIVRLLHQENGITVSKATVGRWVRESRAASHQAAVDRWASIKASRRTGKLGAPHARPESKLVRMRVLREAGLSHEAVAKVMRVDFGDELTRAQVENALKVGRYPERHSRAA